MLGVLLVTGWLIWVGAPLLTLWQQLPVIGNNSITRAQSIVGFLVACLVGLGFDRLTQRSTVSVRQMSATPRCAPGRSDRW